MLTSLKKPTDKLTLTRDLLRIAEIGDIGQLHELLARGADVNLSSDAGVTALMIAAYYGRLEMVRALTDRGADVNLVDREGFTAAMLAQHSGHRDIVRTLIARGAKKTSAPINFDPLPGSRSPDEDLNTLNCFEVEATSTHSPVRTLRVPPDIWEVVHETRVDFDPKSAFIGHLPPIRILALSVIALVLVAGSVIGFMKFRRGSSNSRVASPMQMERRPTLMNPAVQNGATLSSAHQSDSQPTEPVSTHLPAVQPVMNKPAGSSLATSQVKSRSAVAVRAEQDKHVAASARRQAGNATLVGADNQSVKTKAGETSAKPPKFDIAVPQPTREEGAGANDVKKREVKQEPNKTDNSPAVVPAKATPTPKLKE